MLQLPRVESGVGSGLRKEEGRELWWDVSEAYIGGRGGSGRGGM